MIVHGFSKALFSTWFFLPEIRSVFDAGEGINYSLGGRLVKAQTVFLSHGHTDHFTGLLNLLIARTRLGPREGLEPLYVYYPGQDHNLTRYIEFIKEHLQTNGFPTIAHFQPVTPDQDVALPMMRRHFVRVFPIKHGPLAAVGYCVFETRDKLRPEYAAASPTEVSELITTKGKNAILQSTDVPLVCYTGDSECAVDAPCSNPKLLMHEATFLNDADRGDTDHATLREALESATRLKPDNLLLFHFSSRYTAEEIRQQLDQDLSTLPLPDCKVSFVLPGRYFKGQ